MVSLATTTGNKLKKLWYFLTSMKTGLVLIILVSVACAAGTLLPGHGDFYRSYWFQCLVAALALNLLACIIKRSVNVKRNCYKLWPLLTHTGFFVILTGVLASSLWGDAALVRLPVGETFNTSSVLEKGASFDVVLEDFTIERYQNGQPSEYISRVTIVDGDNSYGPREITVNSPLEYRGVKLHQATFGTAVKVTWGHEIENAAPVLVPEGGFVAIPGTDYSLKVYRYIPHYDPRYGMESKSPNHVNPRVIYSVYFQDRQIGVGAAKLDEVNRVGKDNYFRFSGPVSFSGLQVKTDPGVPVVWLGCGLLLGGILMSFYLQPRLLSGSRKTVAEGGKKQ